MPGKPSTATLTSGARVASRDCIHDRPLTICAICAPAYDRAYADLKAKASQGPAPRPRPGSQQELLEALCRELLEAIGENPERAGLEGTPRRWARWWLEFAEYDDRNINTTFESASTDQMVVVRGIRVWSMCEHHLLPFWCDLTMGYIPRGRVMGLSKFGRIARLKASRLQLQERLTEEIASELVEISGSPDIAVVGEGEHLCMTMRGARTPHRMSSSKMLGAFRESPVAREEFFHLARGRGVTP